MTQEAKTAVLLLNTGSPDKPTTESVREYLAEFLSDPRVVELPRWKWWPILHGIILRTRPAKSAARYQGVWMDEGAPLVVHTKHTVEKLDRLMNEKHSDVRIYWAMCYGHPSVSDVMVQMQKDGIERLLVMPLFAQYAPQTTASCFDAVAHQLVKCRNIPSLRLTHDYHDHPAYIEALRRRIANYWAENGTPMAVGGKLLMSFHGVPKSCVTEKGDVYEEQCRETARLLAEALLLKEDDWTISFQSRFGREEWLQPYAIDTAKQLGEEALPRLDVVCPGFAADCLETIEEIADELDKIYRAAVPAGKTGDFRYIPALNDSDSAVSAYAEILEKELAGWI